MRRLNIRDIRLEHLELEPVRGEHVGEAEVHFATSQAVAHIMSAKVYLLLLRRASALDKDRGRGGLTRDRYTRENLCRTRSCAYRRGGPWAG